MKTGTDLVEVERRLLCEIDDPLFTRLSTCAARREHKRPPDPILLLSLSTSSTTATSSSTYSLSSSSSLARATTSLPLGRHPSLGSSCARPAHKLHALTDDRQTRALALLRQTGQLHLPQVPPAPDGRGRGWCSPDGQSPGIVDLDADGWRNGNGLIGGGRRKEEGEGRRPLGLEGCGDGCAGGGRRRHGQPLVEQRYARVLQPTKRSDKNGRGVSQHKMVGMKEPGG